MIIKINEIFNILKKYKDYIILSLVIISCLFKFQVTSFLFMSIYIINFISDRNKMINYCYILFLICSNIGGVLFIELSKESFYLYEIAQNTSQANSLSSIILAHVMTLEAIKFFEKRYSSKFKNVQFKFDIKLMKYAGIALTILMLAMFLKVIDKPFYALGYDRFAYQKNILSGFEMKLGSALIWVTPLFYILIKNKQKTIGILGILLFNIYFFWIGHKFSVFFMAVQLGFIALVDNIDYMYLKKYTNVLIISFIIMISAVMFQSTVVQGRSFTDNIEYLRVRLAQQGQLWWAVYKEEEYHDFHLEEAKKELDAFFVLHEDNDLKHKLGMFKVMRLVAPEEIVEAKIEQGSRYAYSTQANILYYFNYLILLIFSVLLGLGMAFITNLLINYIRKNDLIGIVLISKLWITYVRMFSNSDFDTIFSIENLIIIAILISMNILQRKGLLEYFKQGEFPGLSVDKWKVKRG